MSRIILTVILPFCGLLFCTAALAQTTALRLTHRYEPQIPTRMSYEFQCADGSYAITLEINAQRQVRLTRLNFPPGPVPASERKALDEALTQYSLVEQIRAKCTGGKGSIQIIGWDNKDPAGLQEGIDNMIYFENGHITGMGH